ncbi:7196_t:CDS:1, partial [Entrophospora sp. SA101]
MTNPMLLKSIAYMIDLASNEHYVSFLEKPIMIANNVYEGNENDDEYFPEQKGDREFKYRGKLIMKEPSFVTPSQGHQALRTLNINVE